MKLQIYDNTLRDGEQTAGVIFCKKDKFDILKKLVEAGIKRIEAGFICVSEAELDTLRFIVKQDIPAQIFCLSRLTMNDIEQAVDIGIKNITLFTSSSDILMQRRLHKSESEIEEDIKRCVSFCKDKELYVRFSCEDAMHTPIDRLLHFYGTARQYGADFASVPDTRGSALPNQYAGIIRTLRCHLDIPLSAHCHNDLGLANANAISAVEAGAMEVQTTVNGLGERAGNTALEEFILAMYTGYGCDLGIKINKIIELSELVAQLSGIPVHLQKAIVGRGVFQHESGLHVQFLLDKYNHSVYEAFSPALVGRQHEVVYGKHSGKHNIQYLCSKIGVDLNQKEIGSVLLQVKKRAEEKVPVLEDSVIEMIRKIKN